MASVDLQSLTGVTAPAILQPLSKSEQPSLDTLLKDAPRDIEDAELKVWDSALFAQELVALKIAPKASGVADQDNPTVTEENDGQIEEGTWGGTQVALTDMFNRIETGYLSFFMALGIDTSIPQIISDRAKLFPWSDGADKYPPHLDVPRAGGIPKEYDAASYEIFSKMGLLNAAGMLIKITPKNFLGRASYTIWSKFEGLVNGRNDEGATMAALEKNNRSYWGRKTAQDVMQGRNLGDLPDWWSDARFAQQQFTGTNPTTIELASPDWIDKFRKAAGDKSQVANFLSKADSKSLYVQDCSYFRKAVKVGPSEELKAEDRYCTAPVTLFHLPETGQLHPIAIIIDWKGSIEKSVVTFNKRLEPLEVDGPDYEKDLEVEKADWPWRYAKMCAQQADWMRHEIAIHLVNTHLVEEVICVAANRVFDVHHPVFKLLEPHWYRTLPLNAAARDTLVPKIIFDLVGLKDDQPFEFINYSFNNFRFVDLYIPKDLEKRGFPLGQLSDNKFRNYPYAKNMLRLWNVIHNFVSEMLKLSKLDTDASVAKDASIQSWSREIQTSGKIPSFPTIRTHDQLVDAITMCIHIASPQHTAVNYLQNFYHAFVPAKPPALYQPPPSSLGELQRMTEADLLRALPVNHQREWLLATQVPWLLSFKTAEDASLKTYATSLYNLVRKKSGADNQGTAAVARQLYNDLRVLADEFVANSNRTTKGTIPYIVMNPVTTAISILI